MKAGPGDPAKTAAHRDKNQSKKPCQVHRLSNDTLIFYSTAAAELKPRAAGQDFH